MSNRSIGPFELEKKLGVGGMGIVYLATYNKTGQKVAVKVLSPVMSANERVVKRFDREMEILKRLDHKNIVKYYGGGRHNGQAFYAMQYMDGGSLEDVLERKGKLSWEQAVDVAKQVAKALEHAHKHGIVHRDLKPANLFLTKRGHLKLGDFGIARDTEATALTAAGKTVGTYSYMAPEQITGEQEITGKTDQYALGCMIYQMIAGQVPFESQNPAQLLMMHVEHDPHRLTRLAPECPLALESVVLKLMAKDPADRYYDALAVQVALDDLKEQVAAPTSVAKQTIAGRGKTTVAASQDDKTELKRLLRKKKRKKKRGPFYEQVWFLASCLVLLIAFVVWWMWPLSKETLHSRAADLMATDDTDRWRVAREKYLDELIEKFPDSEEAGWAREQIDRIEIEKTERQAKVAMTLNREPRSPGERRFIVGLRAERQQDRITALMNYRSMLTLLKPDGEDRYFRILAQRAIDRIESEAGSSKDRKLIVDALREAEELADSGQTVKANAKWSSIVTAYAGNKEFERYVEYARKRRDGENVEKLDLDALNAAKSKAGSGM